MKVICAVGAGWMAQLGVIFGAHHLWWVVGICAYAGVTLALYSIHEALKDFRA